MLDLTTVTAALTTGATSLQQIILPEKVTVQNIDSATVLLSLIESAVSSRVYPIVLPNEPTYPAAVYQLTGAERIEVDGYPILRDDTYAVATLAETYAAASSACGTMRAALLAYSPTGDAGTADILDQGDGYDDDFELFESDLQIQITHLARSSQDLPAAFVYPLQEDWEAGGDITCVTGMARSRFVVLLVAKIPTNGVSALGSLRDDILGSVVGLQPSGWSRIEPEGGGVVTVHSSLILWRDVFSTVQTRAYS